VASSSRSTAAAADQAHAAGGRDHRAGRERLDVHALRECLEVGRAELGEELVSAEEVGGVGHGHAQASHAVGGSGGSVVLPRDYFTWKASFWPAA
jgi:hypothetical protein